MKAIGTAVTGGMISATFIDLIFIPLFFVVVTQWFAKKKKTPELPASSSASASTPEAI
jgi:biopolymer transport protein ExbD